jgi:hypothetical protein
VEFAEQVAFQTGIAIVLLGQRFHTRILQNVEAIGPPKAAAFEFTLAIEFGGLVRFDSWPVHAFSDSNVLTIIQHIVGKVNLAVNRRLVMYFNREFETVAILERSIVENGFQCLPDGRGGDFI